MRAAAVSSVSDVGCGRTVRCVANAAQEDERAFEEAGLYDPASPTAADRLAALRYMVDHGTSLAYLKAGNDRGRLFAGQTMAVLWGDIEWLTLGDVAERAGLEEETLRRLRNASGLPDPGSDRACPATEVELWQAAAAGISLVGERTFFGFLRSLGAAATASAEATLALARDANPLSWKSEAGYAEWAFNGAQLIAQIPRGLDVLFRLNVPLAGDRILRYTEAPEEFTEFTVGFVDLVDSTTAVERLGSQQVVRAMADFAQLASTARKAHRRRGDVRPPGSGLRGDDGGRARCRRRRASPPPGRPRWNGHGGGRPRTRRLFRSRGQPRRPHHANW